MKELTRALKKPRPIWKPVQLSIAQNIRPEAVRLLNATDAHPLARFHVDGPLSNMPAFAQAYQCKEGDPMVRPPEKRCQIW